MHKSLRKSRSSCLEGKRIQTNSNEITTSRILSYITQTRKQTISSQIGYRNKEILKLVPFFGRPCEKYVYHVCWECENVDC